jgi:hypothetical protein
VYGFQSGDSYHYRYSNQKASKTYTDDDYYYVHKGKFDIFNFSRKPGMDVSTITEEFVLANKFKSAASEIFSKGTLSFINTGNPSIIAYKIDNNFSTILVVLNKNLIYPNEATIVLKNYKEKDALAPLKIESVPTLLKDKLKFNMQPGEVNVMLINRTS